MTDHEHACEVKEVRDFYCCNHGCEKNAYCGLYSAGRYLICDDVIYMHLGGADSCDKFIDIRSPFLRTLLFVCRVVKGIFLAITAPVWGTVWLVYYVTKAAARKLDPADVERIASSKSLTVYGFAFRHFGIGWAVAKKKEESE